MTILLRLMLSTIWLMAVALMLVKTYRSATVLYRIQAVAESVVAAGLAVALHIPWLWLSAILIVLIKGGLIPRLMARTASTHADYSAKGPLGMATLLILAFILSAGGILLGKDSPSQPALTGLLFAALFVAFLHLSSRYELWSLLWALLNLDTVAGAAALVFGTGLPEIADVGINAASLGLALVLSYLAFYIDRIKGTRDVRDLEELIG